MSNQEESVKAEQPARWRRVVGWIAVSLNLGTACLWSIWGGAEAFHEGWWHPSLLENVLWTLAYQLPGAIFVLLGILGIRWPRLGASILLAFTIWFWWWWRVPAALASGEVHPIHIAMTGIGGLAIFVWWAGRPEPKRWAYRLTWALPLLCAVVSSVHPASMVFSRINDHNFGQRAVSGNEVQLVWAPQGPGWPLKGGTSWESAKEVVSRLNKEGTKLEATPQGFWRLPTLEECVRSASRHGKNSRGVLDKPAWVPRYDTQPDKETPLWNPQSEVIYWWTSDVKDGERTWSYCYNGSVLARRKGEAAGTLAFRAVRSTGADQP